MNRYAKLLGIDLRHAFYRSGWCAGVGIAPLEASATLLRNHRGIYQARPGGLDVLLETDADGKPLLPFPPGSKLSFQLDLREQQFQMVTDSAPPADGADFQLAQDGAGVLVLTVQRDFNQLPGASVQLDFAARKLHWLYYLVTDRSGADSDFAISTTPAQASWQPDHAADGVAARLAQQYPGARVLRFASTQALACREDGLAGTRLLLAGTPVMENLPSPTWRNFFKASLATTSDSVDAIFQIVKYLSNTSLTKV